MKLAGVSACDRLLAPIFSERVDELFLVALLDAECGLDKLLLAGGSKSEVQVDVAAIFKEALNARAQAIILAHNHPSGNEDPSRSDKILTKSLVLASEALDIYVVDHLIFARGRLFSFRQGGLL